MNKVTKIICAVLLLVSVALTVVAFACGFKEGLVDAMLYWAYALVAAGAVAAVGFSLFSSLKNNAKKTLITLGIGLVGLAAIVGGAYLLASGDPVHIVGAQPSDATLKLTDTILNITYFTLAVSVVSIILAAVVNSVRSK